MLLAAVLSGAGILRDRAKQLAPFLTITLKRSIHVGGDTGFTPGEGYDDIGGQVTTPGGARVEVGTNLVYAAIQEFGGTIKRVSTRGKQYTIQIPPTAYLRGAFLEKKPDVIQEIDLALDAMIRDALK